MVLAALKSKSWAESLEKNDWTPAVLTGPRSTSSSTTSSPACAPRWTKSGMV
jgi:putative tricarboxylic transport membrane protein